MKNILLLSLTTVLLTANIATGQENLAIYCNDSTFHQIKFHDGILINHSTGPDSYNVDLNDWIYGEVTVPLTAIDSCVIRRTDIPVLKFTFPDYPTVDCLWDKENYINASLDIEGCGFTDDTSGLSLQVKGRGNSTWQMPKKPMRLKFAKKTSICGLKKAKSYVLLNNYLDPSLMRNALAMWLAKRLGVPYANTIVPCHVFINGHYAGAYTLTEKIGINGGSVDIDDNEGILFELGIEFDEKYQFKSKIWELPVMVKDPDFDELYEDNPDGMTPDELLKAWTDDFNTAEALVYEGKGAEVFDIESAVNYILLNLFTGNSELMHPKSLYMHKISHAPDEKYYLGPAWDFDTAFNLSVESSDRIVQRLPDVQIRMTNILNQLSLTPEFQECYANRLAEFQSEILPDLLEYLDSYARIVEPSAKLNGLRWPARGRYSSWAYLEPSFDTQRHVDELRKWIIARAAFLSHQ